jgi:hypothetical protein
MAAEGDSLLADQFNFLSTELREKIKSKSNGYELVTVYTMKAYEGVEV